MCLQPPSTSLLARPKNSLAHPKNSLARPKNSLAHPKNSLARPKNSLARPKNSLARPKNSLARPKNSLAHPKNSLARPKNSLARPKNSLARPMNSLARPMNSLARPKKAVFGESFLRLLKPNASPPCRKNVSQNPSQHTECADHFPGAPFAILALVRSGPPLNRLKAERRTGRDAESGRQGGRTDPGAADPQGAAGFQPPTAGA